MTRIVPRWLVHRGSVEASGFLIDDSASDVAARVLALLGPGASVQRLGSGLLVRLARPRRTRCDQAPGLPLVLEGDVLVGMPLIRAELGSIAASSGAVVIARHGSVVVETPDRFAPVDPATWLDVSVFEAIVGAPLGSPPTAVPLLVAPVRTETRQLFSHAVGGPPEEHTSLVEKLRALQNGHAAAEARAAEGTGASGAARGTGGILALATLLMGRIARALTPSDSAASPAPRHTRALAVRPAAPRGPGWLEGWATRLHDLLARALLRTRMARMLGRRHAEYVQRMVEAFEQGRLDDALRLAIPIPRAGSGNAPLALSMPAARNELTVRAGEVTASSTIFVGDGFPDLATLYRRAFERLEREGRIDEAAFVLAELLHANEEAVSFLERHGRRRLAAEMAEARGLPVGLVVRQWFLAGDRARAIWIARRSGAFADAVLRLERAQAPEAETLRLLWAGSLADAGDLCAAVEVAWPIERARFLAREWIDRGIEREGPGAARLLVRKLELVPAAAAEIRDHCLAILQRHDHEVRDERRAIADALLRTGPTATTQSLAASAARAMLRDAANASDPAASKLADRLIAWSGDKVLAADVPAQGGPSVVNPSLALGEIRRDAFDVGAMVVHDAVPLPRGRVLVALGEVGVRLLAPDGRALAHFDHPAEHLVISDHGDRAITVARRGAAVRLARIDLVGRRAEPWCDAELDTWAPDFDGSQWIVARGGDLLVADALESRLAALHAFRGIGESVLRIARSTSRATAVLRTESSEDGLHALQRWQFSLPDWIVRERAGLSNAMAPVACSANGMTAGFCVDDVRGELALELRADATKRTYALDYLAESPTGLEMDERWVALLQMGSATRVLLLDHTELKMAGTVVFDGSARVAVRLGAASAVFADDRGRILVVDLVTGSVSDMRI